MFCEYQFSINVSLQKGEKSILKKCEYTLGNGGICLGINYSVSNETKRDE
jgi:hypothetical protein